MTPLPRSLVVFLFAAICVILLYVISINNKLNYVINKVQQMNPDPHAEDPVKYNYEGHKRLHVIHEVPPEPPNADHLEHNRLHPPTTSTTMKPVIFQFPPDPIPDHVNISKDDDGKRNIDSYMPKLEGENIVSTSLWGTNTRYTQGAIRNAELVKEFFPGWKMRVYVEEPSDSPKYSPVPKHILDKLRSLGAELYFMEPYNTKVPPMMWRFLIADDMSVDHFIVRDVDSRLSGRDAAAVYEWIKSDKAFNCIRDHPSHASYPLSGGMWGAKPLALREIFRRSWKEMMYGYKADYLQDMDFLNKVIWPRVKAHMYCSDSVSCDKWPGAHPFPIHRYGHEHVGQVYNDQELARPIDISIIASTSANSKCVPPR